MRQAQKMEAIGRLAGGVAHDFNNILMVINGLSETVLELLEPESPIRSDLEEILEAGRRAAALTSQLLAFSRKRVLQSSTFDLDETITAMQPMLRRLLGSDVRLDVEGSVDRKWIVGRPRPDRARAVESRRQCARRHAAGRTLAHRDVAGRADARVRRRDDRPARGDPSTLRLRTRHVTRSAGAAVRAVFHHQGAWQGHGPRPLDGLRHRLGERRDHPGRQRNRRGHTLHDCPAARRRASRDDGARARGRRRRHDEGASGRGPNRTRPDAAQSWWSKTKPRCGRSSPTRCAESGTVCWRRATPRRR